MIWLQQQGNTGSRETKQQQQGNTGSRETKKKTVLRGCAAARMAAQPKNLVNFLWFLYSFASDFIKNSFSSAVLKIFFAKIFLP